MESDATQNSTKPPNPAPPAIDPRAQPALDRIKSALSRRQGDEAVRFYKEALSHGILPRDDHVLPWLRRSLGTEITDRLLSAFARLPCFYCNKGMVTCGSCDGRGHGADGALCTECLALGVGRCDFCGGSGWFTIDHMPRALRASVIVRRVAAAATEAAGLLEMPVPLGSAAGARETRRRAAKTLLQVNRVLGVLENMVVAARHEGTCPGESAGAASKAISVCESLGPRLQERTRQLLGALSEAARTEASEATAASTRGLAQARADLYQRLALSGNYAGTTLRHPLLLRDRPPASAEPERAEAAGSPEPGSAPGAA